MAKRISGPVLEVLQGGLEVGEDGRSVKIARQLDRKLYAGVNEVLELLGGKWSRRERAHLFPEPFEKALEQVLTDGEVGDPRRELDQFFTPLDVAALVVRKADVAGRLVLEPSAGAGALADVCVAAGARKVVCVEKHPVLAERLRERFEDVTCADFLDDGVGRSGALFERVTMNPPFSRRQDVKHVIHAYEMLASGGLLVAVMSAGTRFRSDRLTTEFRALVGRVGEAEELPDGSFKSSGTDVRTVLVTLRKP